MQNIQNFPRNIAEETTCFHGRVFVAGDICFMTTSDYVKNLSINDIDGEIWKEIKGYPSNMVSNYGRVKSIGRSWFNGKTTITMKPYIMKQKIGTTGYFMLRLTNNKVSKTLRTHRLIAIAFIPNPDNKREVNHKDGDKINNLLSNLEWSTPSENIIHSIETGLRKYKKGYSNLKISVPIVQMDKNGVYIKTWNSGHDACKSLGVSQGNISQALRGKLKTYAGFTWKYLDENYLINLQNENNTQRTRTR